MTEQFDIPTNTCAILLSQTADRTPAYVPCGILRDDAMLHVSAPSNPSFEYIAAMPLAIVIFVLLVLGLIEWIGWRLAWWMNRMWSVDDDE